MASVCASSPCSQDEKSSSGLTHVFEITSLLFFYSIASSSSRTPGAMTTKSSLAKQLQVESLAILLHPGLPLPLCSIVTLASGSSNALVDSPQL